MLRLGIILFRVRIILSAQSKTRVRVIVRVWVIISPRPRDRIKVSVRVWVTVRLV
jgi:hypothetical protein